MKKSALGRGLGALLEEVSEVYENEVPSKSDVVEIDLEDIQPNPYQPRKNFDEESLKELAQSIKKDGLIQPIVVVEDEFDGYVIVAGERRFRATKLAGFSTIKAVVIDISKEEMQQFALIENIQREDLNPIELAKSYESLIKLHGITHQELSSVIHKSRTHITNTLRLLNLSDETQQALLEKKISAGHAKILVGLDKEEQKLVVDSIIGQKLSVRDVEKMVKSFKNVNKSKKNEKKDNQNIYLKLDDLIKKLKKHNLNIKTSSNKLTINFKNQEEIDYFLSKIVD
jgi:ParB family chromosome partitioning protein